MIRILINSAFVSRSYHVRLSVIYFRMLAAILKALKRKSYYMKKKNKAFLNVWYIKSYTLAALEVPNINSWSDNTCLPMHFSCICDSLILYPALVLFYGQFELLLFWSRITLLLQKSVDWTEQEALKLAAELNTKLTKTEEWRTSR